MLESGVKAAPFASPADHEVCRRLHRRYGTTYYFATLRFPSAMRRRIHAVYGFVRVPDEWVDNPESLHGLSPKDAIRKYREEFLVGRDGKRPEEPVLRAFCDVCQECEMPADEPLRFLDAMESDLTVARYESFADLQAYMRGSASAVGIMMCHVLGVSMTSDRLQAAMALGEAMQLTNFLRDVGEDLKRGRIYLPQEDLRSFGLTDADLLTWKPSEAWNEMMRFQIARARSLYAQADPGIDGLPASVKKPVRLARVLYSRILDRIEDRNYDVFSGRARTSRSEKLLCAARMALDK